MALDGDNLEERGARYLNAVARLKPAAALSQAQTELTGVSRRLESQFPSENKDVGVKVIPLQEQLVGNVRLALLVLLTAVGFVLLIACANVANLLLAKAAGRRKEIAVRLALGASRLRIIQQLLTESLLLSAMGGIGGLLVAVWAVQALRAAGPADLPRVEEISIDGHALLFTSLIAVATGVLFGLVPALQSVRTDLHESLKDGGKGTGGGGVRSSMRDLLVVTEIALALVLLIGAGLMVRSFSRLQQVDLGFRPENASMLRISLPRTKYVNSRQIAGFYSQAVDQISALPGVQSVGIANMTPLSGDNFYLNVDIEGHQVTDPNQRPSAEYRAISQDYFRAIGTPLKQGRLFTNHDDEGATQVVIINEELARRYWPNEQPIGKRLTIRNFSETPREVIGIVGNMRDFGAEAEFRPELYVPYQQSPAASYDVVVRTSSQQGNIVPTVRGLIRAIDRDIPIYKVQTLDQVVAQSVSQSRFSMILLGLFSLLALVLANVGIYGVVTYSVTQRTNEIGLRIALGAQRSNVFQLVLGQVVKLTLIGTGIGLVAAFVLTRAMSSLLFNISATDPVTFFGIPLLLGFVSLVACYLPARRATRLDPIVAFRCD
jgi:putative ABC transport system permease protein